jgi:hypothetical protein
MRSGYRQKYINFSNVTFALSLIAGHLPVDCDEYPKTLVSEPEFDGSFRPHSRHPPIWSNVAAKVVDLASRSLKHVK